MSSHVRTEDFIKEVVSGSNGSQQGENRPSLSSNKDSPGSVPTTPAEAQPPPGTVRRLVANRAFRKIKVDMPGPPVEPQGQDTDETVDRRASLDKPLVYNTPLRFPGTASHDLIRKYTIGDKKGTNAAKPSGPAHTWSETPETVFSRPRIVVLQNLPLETQAGDIIQAINEATEAANISHQADRISDVRVLPRPEDEDVVVAEVEFLHPYGARSVHDLVEKGKILVRGAAPCASLIQAISTPKLSGDFGIGAVRPAQDREEYFASPSQRKIVRRTRVYGQAVKASLFPSLSDSEVISAPQNGGNDIEKAS
ncbi:hypothetical protein VPNG_04409 [Cytospora leucostoma]|uniref:Uncharacterized protein n=1 Tax=Cytospora leucostoma TaxID=1230097 RepID=A0A423XBS6_9PEZI|nr:hypothetical protein VPNG_04409 [Cytospora leucostoma]